MKKAFLPLFVLLASAAGISAQTVILEEDFSLVTDSNSYSIANSIDSFTHVPGWTADWVYPCTGKVKIGKASAAGFLQTPPLDLSGNGGQFVISFDAEAWYNDNRTLNVYVDNTLYTATDMDNDGSYGSYKHYEIQATGGTTASTVKFMSSTASKGRFFIDNIRIVSQVDTTPPAVSSVNADESTVEVTFSKALDAVSAQTVSNYSLDNSIAVASATLNGSAGNTVVLNVQPNLTEGTTYTLIVSGVADINNRVMTPDTLTFTYGVQDQYIVHSIAELRSKLDYSDNSARVSDDIVYKLDGDVIVTAVAAYNNQKVIQDSTGAILIYDNNGIFGDLSVGDQVSNIYGTLTNYYGFLEFIPTKAHDEVTAIFQDVAPLEVTLAQLADNSFMYNHQAELIRLNGAQFVSTGTFATLNRYVVSQNSASDTAVFPYFQDVDYIGSDIPTTQIALTGFNFATGKIGNVYPDFRYYLVPRSSADMNATGIEERIAADAIVLYPNPVRETLHVTLGSEAASVCRLAVYDLNGRMVQSQTVNAADGTVTVNCSALPSGTYFIRLSDGKRAFVGRFVK